MNRPLTTAILLLCTTLASLSSLPASGHTPRREHQAHVHGKAELNLVLDANILQVEFSLPMADLVGFEHQPTNEKEKQQWLEAETFLKTPTRLLQLDANAHCVAEPAAPLEKPWAHTHKGNAGQHQPDHKHKHAPTQTHTHEHWDLKVQYRFVCQKSSALKTLQLPLFERLSSLKEVAVQYVTPAGQGHESLTPTKRRLELGKGN